MGNQAMVKRDSYLMRANAYEALKQEEEAAGDYSEARRAAHVHHKSTSASKLMEADFSEKAVRHHFILARTCLHGTIINLPTALKCC